MTDFKLPTWSYWVWSWDKMWESALARLYAPVPAPLILKLVFIQPSGRLKNGPLKYPNPVTLYGRVWRCDKVRILTCGGYLGSSWWALNTITSVLYEMEAERDLTLEEKKTVAMASDIGVMCPRNVGSHRSWKRQRMNSSLGPGGSTALPIPRY